MQVSSPDISNLEFSVLFDLSSVPPVVTITNASTVTDAADLKWWFVITTPLGATIHAGSLAAPDVNAAAFTTKSYNTWPSVMSWGTYTVTVYVRDSANNTFQLQKKAIIIRPTGNLPKVNHAFGSASVITNVNCSTGELYVEDTTPYRWMGIQPTFNTSEFILVFPADSAGNQPDSEVREGSNGLFVITESSDAYQLVRNTVATYALGDGVTVRLKYKYREMIEVECSADLCRFVCDYRKMIAELSDGSCDTASHGKLIVLNGLMNIALIAKLQPGCGVKASDMVAEIKKLGIGECDCGPDTTGINGTPSNPGNPGTPDPAPQLEYVQLVTKGSSNPPAECPGDPFPKEVWTPDANTSLGIVNTSAELLSKLIADNSAGGWSGKGVWSPAGLCQVALSRGAGITGNIPKIPVSAPATGQCEDGVRDYYSEFKNYGNPTGAYVQPPYPFNIYVKTSQSDTAPYLIQDIQSYADLVGKLNQIPTSKIPDDIDFLPANVEGKVLVHDTGCVIHPAITILVQVEAYEEVVYGAATNMQTGLTSGIYGADLKNGTQELGVVCGTKWEDYLWHHVKVGGYIYYVDTEAGEVRKVDMTNPLSPSFLGSVKLPAIGGTPYVPFSGSPLYNGNVSTPSHYDVYFPTDVNSEVKGFLYVTESASGYIWKYRLSDDTVVAQVQDNRLYGRCPRLLLNDKLYFTVDGSRETEMGLTSGLARNVLAVLDVTTVVTGGTLSINTAVPPTGALAGTEPWALSYDKRTQYMYITASNGSLVRYNPFTASMQLHSGQWGITGTLTKLANTYLDGDRLYLSCSGARGSMWLDISQATTLPVTTGQAFDLYTDVSTGNVLWNHYNVMPIAGKSYVVVTVLTEGLMQPRGYLMVFTRDGHFIKYIRFQSGGPIYNLTPYYISQAATPNGLCS